MKELKGVSKSSKEDKEDRVGNILNFTIYLYSVEMEFLGDSKRYSFLYRDHVERTVGEVAGLILHTEIMYADNTLIKVLTDNGWTTESVKDIFFRGDNICWISVKKE